MMPDPQHPSSAAILPRPALRWRFLAGAALALLLCFLPGVADLPDEARATTGVAALTAWCWLTGALPLPIASLLPAFLLPATGAAAAKEVAPAYFQDIILLFLGGFILALSLERYALHRRFALRALRTFGSRPRRVVFGFMATSAVLSMFISNTSTALLMLPVAMAVLHACPEEESSRLGPPLLLGIAYACSLGGIGTPVGTAPNAVLIGQFADRFPKAPELAFGTWVIGALPFVAVFLLLVWWTLTRVTWKLPDRPLPALEAYAAHGEERGDGGRLRVSQRRVLWIFALVALLWMSRKGVDFGDFGIPGWSDFLPSAIAARISDSTVALLGVVLLFLVPGEGKGGALLDWEDCMTIPWGILLLLGGGFALAKACDSSGLSAAIGELLGHSVDALSPVATVALIAFVVSLLTNITSNTATISLLLPLLFSAAVAARVHPMLLAIPATFAVSCAFMLPVGTPPNAILFSSGEITIPQMVRAGLLLNLIVTVLVTAFTFLWIAPKWGFDLSTFPAWAQ